jgi:hypothetical protein
MLCFCLSYRLRVLSSTISPNFIIVQENSQNLTRKWRIIYLELTFQVLVSPPTEGNWLEASRIISEDNIKWAIVSFGPFKTAGEDDIVLAHLKSGLEVLINPLQKIFTPAWLWLYTKTVGKREGHLYTSLTYFFLKTMERIVDKHIRTGPLKRFSIHKSQHAYQRSRSCGTALHNLENMIEGALNHKIFSFGPFLDIEGSFDNATFNLMVMASLEHAIDDRSTKWIVFMLKYRTVRAEAS